LPQRNPSNQAADLSSGVTKNLENPLTGDDELLRKTVQIDKNAGNDEVSETDDANNVIHKNNSNINDAEANKGNLATNAIESEVLIEGNKADKPHAKPVATYAIESSSPTEANEFDHEGVAERQGSKSLGLADSTPTGIPVNVNNDDNDTNNNDIDSNEAVVAEATESNVANDDINTNESNEVIESAAANLDDKQPRPLLRRTLPQRELSNEAHNQPSDVTKNLEISFTQVIGDDELFSETVQMYENSGNDEAAKSDDANAINDKNNADLNDAEVNKANVVMHAI
jgi:hypothetical protein